MRERYGFMAVFWTILACLVICVPPPAYAQVTNTQGNAAAIQGFPPPNTPATALPIDTPLCPGVAEGTNPVDNAARNNQIAQGQAVFTQLQNLSTMFPVQNAVNACLTNLQKVFTALANLNVSTNGFGAFLIGIVGALIAGVIGQVCSMVMSEVTAIQTDVQNLAKICIPKFSLGGFNLPSFNLGGGCGGTSFSLINNYTQPAAPNVTNYNQYLQ